MDAAAYRASILAHLLRLAEFGEENAIQAAGWYEKNEPWFLANLQDKVRQEIERAKVSREALPPEASRAKGSRRA